MTVLADRYELAEELGAGGMARVVAAHDRYLDRRVAIKLIREELLGDATVRDRLLREARAAARLHHPNTVAVYDAGEHDGRGFVVMELVTGTTLAQLLAQGALEPARAVGIMAAVLAGLQAAHQQGLVHRDVKPSNILLPADGGVKLADFGIARGLADATSKLTATGTVLGTPSYLAPEVLGGADAAAASDLYAVGIVLYEALAGRVPFAAESPLAVALAHQRDPLPPLAALAPSVPSQLVEVVERALVKDPTERFVDAAAMRAALLGAVPAAPGAPDQGAPRTGAPGQARVPGPAAALGGTAPLTDAVSGADATARTGDGTRALETAGHGDGEVAEPGGPRWRRPAIVVAILAAAALLGLVFDLGGREADEPITADDRTTEEPGAAEGTEDAGDDAGDGPDADPTDAGTGTPSTDPEEPPPGADDTDPADGTEAMLRDLDGLIGNMAQDPDRYGADADDLRGSLENLRATTDLVERAEDARALMADVAKRIRDGALPRPAGSELIDVLEPIGRPSTAALHQLHAVFATITRDPRPFGDRVDDVLDDLRDLLATTDAADWRDDAAGLLEELDEFVDDGEVRRPAARDLRAALEALTG